MPRNRQPSPLQLRRKRGDALLLQDEGPLSSTVPAHDPQCKALFFSSFLSGETASRLFLGHAGACQLPPTCHCNPADARSVPSRLPPPAYASNTVTTGLNGVLPGYTLTGTLHSTVSTLAGTSTTLAFTALAAAWTALLSARR